MSRLFLQSVRRRFTNLSPLGGGFSPLDISGLQVWYDFSNSATLYQDSGMSVPVTTDADPIGAVTDLSPNGNDSIQATASEKPTWKTNIQNGLAIGRDLLDDELDLNPFTQAQPHTIFAVASTPATSRQAIIGADSQGRVGFHNTARLYMYSGVSIFSAGGQYLSNTFYSLHYITNGASSEIFKNGGFVVTGDAGNLTIDPHTLFSSGGPNHLRGDIGEYLLYDGIITGDDATNMYTYLNDKWALY